MTTASPLGEIIFFNDHSFYNSSRPFSDEPFLDLETSGTLAPLMELSVLPTGSGLVAPASSASPYNQAGFLSCYNWMQDDKTLAIHRNIAAWLVVVLAAIGIVCNAFSLFVLFRTQPRSPTDIYMMHLAAYDVAYEFFFAISMATRTWWPFQMKKSFSFVAILLVCRPLSDLSSNLATVVVTVFAMERLLAIYRPLKILNTSANKRVLWIALVTATLITLPDFCEFTMSFGNNVNVTSSSQIYSTDSTISVSLMRNNATNDFFLETPFFEQLSNLTIFLNKGNNESAGSIDSYQVTDIILDGDELVITAASSGYVPPSLSPIITSLNNNNSTSFNFDNKNDGDFDENLSPESQQSGGYCYHETEFSRTPFYNAYVSFYMVIFTFIPLILLTFANGFLIWGVARASQNRLTLTATGQYPSTRGSTNNAGSIVAYNQTRSTITNSGAQYRNRYQVRATPSGFGTQRGSTSSLNTVLGADGTIITKVKSHQADQQRLTLMLVMIVLIFTVCQLPIAILTLCNLIDEQLMKNFKPLFIYSNILVIVFSTTDFAFYSLFSRRFRQTLNEMVAQLKEAIRKKSQKTRTRSSSSKIVLAGVNSLRRRFLPAAGWARYSASNQENKMTTPVVEENKPMLSCQQENIPLSTIVENKPEINNNNN